MKLISEKTEVEVGNDIRSAMLDSLADRLKEEFLENKFLVFGYKTDAVFRRVQISVQNLTP